MKCFIINADNLNSTFSVIEAGQKVLFDYEKKDNTQVFSGCQQGDMILGCKMAPLPELYIAFQIVNIITNSKIRLEKVLESSVYLELSELHTCLAGNDIFEIDESRYNRLIKEWLGKIARLDMAATEVQPKIIADTHSSFCKRINKRFPLNCILYGAPGTGKTYATAQYALAIVEDKDIDAIALEPRQTILGRYNQLIDDGRIVFTTFHQNYGYEDFIQGIRPDTSSKEMSFKTVDGVFKLIADKAMNTPDKSYVIIIDEINRANISKVFGELITLIEEDKRWGEDNAIKVTLPSGEEFAVPNNLYIVGTMNSADKSISLIDTALRRRFEFIEYVPNLALVSDDKLRTVLDKLNKGIASELNSTDLLVGHSYFMNRSADDLCEIMNRRIIPLLYEYFFDNKKKVEDQIKKAIEGLDVEIKTESMGRIKLVKKVGE